MVSKNDLKSLKRVNRLVAEAFIPNPDNLPQTNHKNGIKTDNRVENLEWCSPQENMKHAVNTGLTGKGTKNNRNVLSNAQVKEIRNSYVPYKHSLLQLAKEFGVSKRCISHIVHGTSWAWLS